MSDHDPRNIDLYIYICFCGSSFTEFLSLRYSYRTKCYKLRHVKMHRWNHQVGWIKQIKRNLCCRVQMRSLAFQSVEVHSQKTYLVVTGM